MSNRPCRQPCCTNLRADYSRCKCGACYCIDKSIVRKVPLSIQHSTDPSRKDQKNLTVYWLALSVGVSSLIFQAAGLQEVLRYSRDAIINGQWWRIVTGNLVHLGYSHLLLNLSGLAVITFLLAPAMSTRHWAIVTLVSMLGVGIGLLILDPQLIWYVGLSGALYGADRGVCCRQNCLGTIQWAGAQQRATEWRQCNRQRAFIRHGRRRIRRRMPGAPQPTKRG